MLIENLIEFGLSEKEAKVYIALLELELATANDVAKKANINRSSTYVVIESLKKKGFLSMSEDKTVKQYVAAAPEFLLGLAKKRALKQEDVISMLQNIMPDLKALNKGAKHKPKVLIYEGQKNVKSLYFGELLKLNDNWRTYEDPTEVEKHFPGYVAKDCVERKKTGVHVRGINPNTAGNRELINKYKDTQSQDENLLIPVEKFKFPKQPIDLSIYGDEVTFYSLQESFAIVIKHQQVVDTLKNIFDLAWEEAKRLNRER